MAIKNYVVNNKRKSTSIFVMLLFMMVAMFVFIYTNNTNAGVYVEDEDGKFKQIYEIKVLEIVAQKGQQVLGYTVKGYEPITVEKINSYEGPMNLDETDFKNVTGYTVKKTPISNGIYTYKVQGQSALNTKFNENVLGESMLDGEIKVNVVQANELTHDDIEWADLVYINSNDSSDKLLYYYDQFMCNGSMGITEANSKGEDYTTSHIASELIADVSLKKISSATGSLDIAHSLMDEDFVLAGLEDYNVINYDRYVEKIAEVKYGSLAGADINETREKVNTLIKDVNAEVRAEAFAVISDKAGDRVITGDPEQQKEVNEALKAGLYEGYNPLNSVEYCNVLYLNFLGGIKESQVETDLILVANGSVADDSYENLLKFKAEGYVYQESDRENLRKAFLTLNLGNEIEELVEKYIDAFLDSSFVYDSDNRSECLKNLIDKVNAENVALILDELVSCIGNPTKLEEFTVNKDLAEDKFIILNVGYIPYNFDEYIEKIKTLTDVNAFNDEDGTPSIDKVATLFDEVNNRNVDSEQSFDIDWRNAVYLAELALNSDVALMYNSELISKTRLGDYRNDLSNATTGLDNTNNMYKMLLLIRQIRSECFKNDLKDSIDDYGYYNKVNAGTGATEKILSWNKDTFASVIKNGNAYNYKKCHEPSVVGDTYSESGTKGNKTNYVHGRIYSFSGAQFFGGKNFVNGTDSDFKSKNTATATSGIAKDKILTDAQNEEIVGKTKGDIIRYILKVSLMSLDSPLRVLEIQPGASVTELGYVDEENDIYGKDKILNYLKLDATPENRALIDVTYMSIKEFNTRADDLMSNYDLIYFGINPGYQVVDEYGRTKYNDTNMNGLVYTGIGDKYKIQNFLRGNVATDYRFEPEKLNLGDSFTSTIENKQGGWVVLAGTPENFQNVWLSTGAQQPWTFIRNSDDGSYEIKIPSTDFALDVYNGKSASGTNVQVYSSNKTNAQRWFIYSTLVPGEYVLVPKNSQGCALDLNTGVVTDQENIQIWTKNSSTAQIFKIKGKQEKSLNQTTYYDSYKYWINNIAGSAFVGNGIPSWNLNVSAHGKWYLKNDTSYSYTRFIGNDLTVKRMNELINYVKAGGTIMLPNEIYNCDSYIAYDGKSANSKNWRYVDPNSKFYNFVKTIKNLGYDSTTKTYTGLDSNGEKVFDDGYKYANIVIDSKNYALNGKNPDNLPDTQKFYGGLTYAVKRNSKVMFDLVKCPTEYNCTYDKNAAGEIISRTEKGSGEVGNTISKTSDEYKKYCFELKLKSNDKSIDWVEQNFDYRIYIDKSGSGRFEKENRGQLIPTITYNYENNSVILEGEWPGNIEGFIPWRVEAFNKSNPNSCYSYSGFSAFALLNDTKKNVYVLWVRNNGDNPLTLDFSKMINAYKDDIEEYKLHVVEISLSDYVGVWKNQASSTEWNSENSKIKVTTMLKNGGKVTTDGFVDPSNIPFDMIVFGYCDSHKALDINSIPAQKDLQYFIDSGHSILYAHDNASYNSSLNFYYKEDVSISGTSWGRYNNAFLRGKLGMDAFGITYSPKVFEPGTDEYVEYIANSRKYIKTNNQEDYRGYIEMMTFIYTPDGSGNQLYSETLNTDRGKDTGTTRYKQNSWQHTKTVERMNQGQISEYPFVIGKTLSVANTHCQYMALNMEDPNLTVWYTLGYNEKGGSNLHYKFTKGDGSNNFYIYSKGNITYTGAGHSTISDDVQVEKKLFINTVIASIPQKNYPPEVILPEGTPVDNEGNAIIYRQEGEDITITFTPFDSDSEEDSAGSFTECKVYVDIDGDGKYTPKVDIPIYNYDDDTESKVVDPEIEGYDPSKKGTDPYRMGDRMQGTKLINNQQYTFIIKNSMIDGEINQAIKNKTKKENDSIYNYSIIIQITDKPTRDGEIPETKTQKFKIVENKLWNLN